MDKLISGALLIIEKEKQLHMASLELKHMDTFDERYKSVFLKWREIKEDLIRLR